LDNLVGVWEGSYIAGQGETGLTLTVTKEGSEYKAVFAFYNLPGQTNAREGSFRMNASLSRGKYTLKAYEWIDRPGSYNYVDLEGTISGDNFSGTGNSGITFKTVRKQ
jgi:hypothetical protein